jgi:hypothetical protein
MDKGLGMFVWWTGSPIEVYVKTTACKMCNLFENVKLICHFPQNFTRANSDFTANSP